MTDDTRRQLQRQLQRQLDDQWARRRRITAADAYRLARFNGLPNPDLFAMIPGVFERGPERVEDWMWVGRISQEPRR